MKKIKNIRKKLNDFLLEESGKMSKDNILKIGIAALGSIAAMSSMFADEVSAEHSDGWHNYTTLTQNETLSTAEYDEWEPFLYKAHASHDQGK